MLQFGWQNGGVLQSEGLHCGLTAASRFAPHCARARRRGQRGNAPRPGRERAHSGSQVRSLSFAAVSVHVCCPKVDVLLSKVPLFCRILPICLPFVTKTEIMQDFALWGGTDFFRF